MPSTFARSLGLALAVALLPTSALAQTARPAKQPPPACGMKAMPLFTGGSWTYKSTPGDMEVVVTVLEVTQTRDEAKKPITLIKVEERFTVPPADAKGSPKVRTTTQTWTCTQKTGLTMSPESFFFSGEPGGGIGMAFSYTLHENVTFPLDKGLSQENGWVEKVQAGATRQDGSGQGVKHPAVKLEMERHVIVHATSPLTIPLGTFPALKIGFDIRGRGVLEPEKVEMPVLRSGAAYLIKGVGLGRIEDCFKTAWNLTATTLALPAIKPAP